MPIVNVKDFDEKTLRALNMGESFVVPSPSPEKLRGRLIEQFLGRVPVSSEDDFLKGVISCCMGELKVQTGVGYARVFLPNETFEGTYGNIVNTIKINDAVADKKILAHKIVVASHETFHKYQEDVSARAKFFGPRQDDFVGSNSTSIGHLLATTNKKNTFYFHSKVEQQAYEYGKTFTLGLLDEAKKAPDMTPDLLAFINYQREYVEKEQNYIQSKITFHEQKFIDKQLPIFYKNATESFDMFYALARDAAFSRDRGAVELRNQEAISRLANIYDTNGINYNFASIVAQANILAYCPERSRVEKFIDCAIQSPGVNTVNSALFLCVRDRIPITKGDFCKLLIGMDATSFAQTRDNMLGHIVNNVDERFLSSALISCYGKETAAKIIFQNADRKFNMEEAKAVFADMKSTPILQMNGRDIYSVEEVLTAVVADVSRRGGISSGERLSEVRAQLAGNLANIVSHYGFPTAQNYNFSQSLVEFVRNPFEKQFPSDREGYSEKSSVFSDRIGKNLEEYMAREKGVSPLDQAEIDAKTDGISSPKTDEKPEFIPEIKPEEQSEIDKKLEISIKNLTEAKIKLAEQISKIDMERLSKLIVSRRENSLEGAQKDAKIADETHEKTAAFDGQTDLEDEIEAEDPAGSLEDDLSKTNDVKTDEEEADIADTESPDLSSDEGAAFDIKSTQSETIKFNEVPQFEPPMIEQ